MRKHYSSYTELQEQAINLFMEKKQFIDDESERYGAMKEVAEEIVPQPEDTMELLILAIQNPWLVTQSIDDYAKENTCSALHLIYENLYRAILEGVEQYWDEIW